MPLGDLREIDIGVLERAPDLRPIDAAIVPVRHALHVHDFLMIGTIVEHDRQQRDAMVRRGPQDSRGKQQIPVALDVHRQPAVFAVGESRANGGRGVVAHAAATRPADELVMLVERPES